MRLENVIHSCFFIEYGQESRIYVSYAEVAKSQNSVLLLG